VEPLEGLEVMRASRASRAGERNRLPGVADRLVVNARRTPDDRLGSGPGLVCAIFDIDRSLTGSDLLADDAAVRLEARPPDEPHLALIASPRVGLGYAGEPWATQPWRLSIADHPSVSRPLPGRGTRRPHRPDSGAVRAR
jgi:3-methyladenine DNA glycosylase Mpg